MPKFKPPAEAVVKRYYATMEVFPQVEQRKMFGCPCAFRQGQMLTGVFEDGLFVRLSPEDRTKFLKQPGARPFEPLPGRVMREYVVFPPDSLDAPATLKRWIKRGLAYVETLPPKVKKIRNAKAAKK